MQRQRPVRNPLEIMKLLKIFFFSGLLLSAIQVQAQPAAYTRMGFGARGVAMSNALVADPFSDTSPYYNPALAPFASRQNLEATVALLSLDRQLQFLQLAAPLRPRAGIAAGLIHAGVSNIDGRDNSGYHTEDYSVDEYTFFLAFGTRLHDRLTAGVGLQLFRADYLPDLQPFNSIGIDVGLSYKVTDALYVGAAVDDLLARYEWDTGDLYGESGKTTTDRFPVRIRIGGAYELLEGRGHVSVEYESHVRSGEWRTAATNVVDGQPITSTTSETFILQENRFRVGAEYQLVDPFVIRAGIDRIGSEAIRPTAGFMVEQPVGRLVTRVEYAFVMEPFDAGNLHFVTLRLFL